MGFFDFLKRGNAVQTEAQPISINVSTKSQFERNVGRMISLYQALLQGDTRGEINEELEMRKGICANFGHEKPNSLEETVELFNRITQ